MTTDTALKEALQRIVRIGEPALAGDSNDAEHDALFMAVEIAKEALADVQAETEKTGRALDLVRDQYVEDCRQPD